MEYVAANGIATESGYPIAYDAEDNDCEY